jgi:hypothetical protein
MGARILAVRDKRGPHKWFFFFFWANRTSDLNKDVFHMLSFIALIVLYTSYINDIYAFEAP